MALTLKSVPPSHGPRWISEAFRLYRRRPLAFTSMALVFYGAAKLVQLLPLVGALLPLMALPLLSLGFMIAAQSALLDGPVHPRQFIEPLRTDATRRRALLMLCGLYGGAMVFTLLLGDMAGNHAWERMQVLMARGDPPVADVQALMPDLLQAGLITGFAGSLLSAVFWHAPALVHWGGQGARQALFSSALAVWRSKGALTLYLLAWLGLMVLCMMVVATVMQALGLQAFVAAVVLPGTMVLSAVFYISVLFTFNDSFGGSGLVPEAAQGAAAP